MKRKTFIIEEYEKDHETRIRQLIWRLLEEEEINLLIRMKYDRKAFNGEALESMARLLRSIGEEKEFIVDLEVATDQWDAIRKYRRILNQYSVRIELKVNNEKRLKEVDRYKEKLLLERICIVSEEYQTFLKLYEKWKTLKIPVCSEYELTTKEYLEFFQYWIHDREASWYVPFEEALISLLTENPGRNCVYNSCMGKYLYLDEENNVYFCAKKKAQTRMFSLSDDIIRNLYNEVYDQFLKQAIEKRKACLAECSAYALCKGGCMLEEKNAKSCMELAQRVSCAAQFLEREMESEFANVENACVRQLYLSLIAYGFWHEES